MPAAIPSSLPLGITSGLEDNGVGFLDVHPCLISQFAPGYLEYGRRAVRAVHIEKPFRRPWLELLHAWAEDTRTVSEVHVAHGHGCLCVMFPQRM